MKPYLKFGLINGFIGIMISMALQYTIGMTDPNAQNLSFIVYIPLVICIFLSQKEQKEQQGFLTYGQGLGNGTMLGVVSGVISAIFFYVFMTFIYPNYLMDMKAAAISKAFADPKMATMDAEQKRMVQEMIGKGFNPTFFIIVAFVSSVIGAFVFSLIIAAFTKKEKPVELVVSNDSSFDAYNK